MEFRAEVRLEVAGASFGAELAKILLGVRLKGSLKEAAAMAGVSYTTAWNMVARAERALGTRLISASRGAGASLTPEGLQLLRRYMAECGKRGVFLNLTGFVYAGSHDPALEAALPPNVEAYFTGSLRGLLATASGEAHFAGIHLGNNVEVVRQLAGHLSFIPGYRREVGIAHRKGVNLDDLARLRLVNRPVGSGTRLLIDRLLTERGLRPGEAPGYDKVAQTHEEAAALVAEGAGDYTITLRYVAEKHGLSFIKLTEEDFDFVALPETAEKAASIVASIELPPGYTPKPDKGQPRRL